MVFSLFSMILPQLRHFHPSKLMKWSKKDCMTINPWHFGHFISSPSLPFYGHFKFLESLSLYIILDGFIEVVKNSFEIGRKHHFSWLLAPKVLSQGSLLIETLFFLISDLFFDSVQLHDSKRQFFLYRENFFEFQLFVLFFQ